MLEAVLPLVLTLAAGRQEGEEKGTHGTKGQN